MSEFHHFGVPTSVQSEGESYVEGAKVYITSPDAHPFRVEFLRFKEGSGMPVEIQKNPHAAFIVPNLDEALAGRNVIVPPFDATEEFRCAFITDKDAVIEVMERR